MIKLATVIILFSVAFALAQDSFATDAIPEPDGDLQYIVFAVFGFLSFLSWVGYKIWSVNQGVQKKEEVTPDTITRVDTQLARDIAENARQISILEKNQEFQEQRFQEFKAEQQMTTERLFGKIDDLDAKLTTKVDNLVNAILKQKSE